MTLEETRQLGIEFERRINTMIPETELAEKLDSDTIYSYLNQYQQKYIHLIYTSLDQIPSGSKISAHVESVLQSMLCSVELNNVDVDTTNITDINGISIIDTARSITYTMPENFYMYIRSVSKVSSTFAFKRNENSTNAPINILPNQLVSQSEVWKLVETPHNSLRILKYPAVILNEYKGANPTITVIYDQYTTINGVKVLYYKQPVYFDIMTSTACELPMCVFEDLVSGAVDLYVDYVAGAEEKRKKKIAQALQRAREDERDARRNSKNLED